MTAVLMIEPEALPAGPSDPAPAVRDLLAAARCAKILNQGARDAAREWARLAGRGRNNAVQGLAALMLCRSPADLIAAHADMMSGRLDLISKASEALSEIVAAAAGEAVRALATQDVG